MSDTTACACVGGLLTSGKKDYTMSDAMKGACGPKGSCSHSIDKAL